MLRPRNGPAWLAMALAALLALLWQSIVQTHVHHPVATAGRAGGVQLPADTRLTSDHAPDDALCPLCGQAAEAGNYLLPAPPAVHVPAAALAWLPVALPARRIGGQRSHAWRSRGPPRLA